MNPEARTRMMKEVSSRWGEILIDREVDLPTSPLVISELLPDIRRGEAYAVLYLSVDAVIDLEKIYGFDKFDQLLIHVARQIKQLTGDAIRHEDTITLEQVKSNRFLIFLSSPRGLERFYPENLESILERVMDRTRENLKELDGIPASFLRINGGYAIIATNPLMRTERCIYRAIQDAKRMSRHREERQQLVFREELKKIIISGDIRTVFHPIVHVPDLVVIGYEALARGPENSRMESPSMLFSIAGNHDLVEDLDRICKIKSLLNFHRQASGLRDSGESMNGIKLFLNTEPKTFLDPGFSAAALRRQIHEHQIEPGDLVLEITERSAITNYVEFKERLDVFRKEGFLVAIDDTGSGYSSLQSIAELKPDFVKVDMALVRNINEDAIKQGLIEALVNFSRKHGIPIIAEGVETIAEFDQLVAMGVEYAQGFYFARPEPQFLPGNKVIIV